MVDQLRLMALDSLYDRMLEFHNNIHVRGEELLELLEEDANPEALDAAISNSTRNPIRFFYVIYLLILDLLFL